MIKQLVCHSKQFFGIIVKQKKYVNCVFFLNNKFEVIFFIEFFIKVQLKKCQRWPNCPCFCALIVSSKTTQGLTIPAQSVECSDRAAPAWQCTWTGTISYWLLPPSRTVDGHNLNMETRAWQQGRPDGLSMGCRCVTTTITVMLTLGQYKCSTSFNTEGFFFILISE